MTERKKRTQQPIAPADVDAAFYGSDAALTRRVLHAVEEAGEAGWLGACLFRAQKSSTRAKCYRGGLGRRGPRYRDLAYTRKEEAITLLCDELQTSTHPWGWARDPGQPFAPWVLYIDLPDGQVSFHALERGRGPDYPEEWDQSHASEQRILAFCRRALASDAAP